MSPKKGVATKKVTRSSKGKNAVEVKNNYISPQNYLYALLILVCSILFVFLIFGWYNAKKEEKLMTSYLITSNTINSSITDLSTLVQIRQEAPANYFIYISYTNDEDVYNLEKELKVIIDDYKLNDIFYYVDMTELKKDNASYLETIKDSLEIDSLNNLPALIYVENGKIVKVLDGGKSSLLQVEDIKNLLNIYEFEKIK